MTTNTIIDLPAMESVIKISVIIPVFGVEKYVGKCCESLMAQTLEEVEYLFIDDASKDKSCQIIEGILEHHQEKNARIIHHKTNKGLPAARNTGLDNAGGEYVFHCDADDWLEPEALQKLYEEAKRNNADFIYCDYFLSFANNERRINNPEYKTAEEYLRRGLLGGTTKFNVWNKLVRKSIYSSSGIRFPEGHSMGEDMTMIKLASNATVIGYVPLALYHYNKINESAFSQTQTDKKLAEIRFNTDNTAEYLTAKFGSEIDRELGFFKLFIKLPFLISDSPAQYKLWREWYPESNKYAFDNADLPLRTRVLQWMAKNNIWLGVKIYYKLVYKFIYGVLYR